MTREEALRVVKDAARHMAIRREVETPTSDYLAASYDYEARLIREALAILSQPVTRPEGVPEFVYTPLINDIPVLGRLDFEYPDGGYPKRKHARYRFDTILTPEKEGE